MATFLALYRGETVNSAQIVAVTAQRDIVAEFAARLLEESPDPEPDPVITHIKEGRRRALEVVKKGA